MTIDCRQSLPALHAPSVTLREPRVADAPALFACLTTPRVSEYVATPPSSAAGFERFICWTRRERRLGRHVCFAIVPGGEELPVGLVQVRQSRPGFGTAEWGFALAEEHWGTGLFRTCASAVVDFTFRGLHVHRLEARVSVENIRGERSIQKLGALREGTLRQSFVNHWHCTDQSLWALDADEWLAAHPAPAYVLGGPIEEDPAADPLQRHVARAGWSDGLPELRGDGVTLRELQLSDADGLAGLFVDPDVQRFIPALPGTPADVARFIQWAHAERAAGTSVSFGVVPDGGDAAVGVIHLHEREAPFRVVEWTVVFGRPYWSTGLFWRSAQALLPFVFETLGVRRLEARAASSNARANGSLRRLGATEEGRLRRSFLLGGEYQDDVLWALLADDWRQLNSGPHIGERPSALVAAHEPAQL